SRTAGCPKYRQFQEFSTAGTTAWSARIHCATLPMNRYASATVAPGGQARPMRGHRRRRTAAGREGRWNTMARTGWKLPQSMGRHRAPRGLADIRVLWLPVELSDADFKESLTMVAETGAPADSSR